MIMMTHSSPLTLNISYLLIAVAFTCNQAFADKDSFSINGQSAIHSVKMSKSFKIDGVKLSENVYMGRTKIMGEYGFGIVVDKKTYSWGFNNQAISFHKRF